MSLGQPLDRVDGRLKVTGGAKYAAEFAIPNLVHAVMITSTIAKGRVAAFDTSAAERAPGVIKIITPFNAPKLPGAGAATMRRPTLLQDRDVHYNGQPIGLAIADTFEHATAASHMVRVRYDEEQAVLDMDTAPKNPPDQVHPLGGERTYARGDFDKSWTEAAVKVDNTYTTPLENHNPMEVHNVIAAWNGDTLTLYESTQGITSVRNSVAKTFGITPENVRVIAYFTGGGFGSKGGSWSHEPLAAMAAREVQRPVKLVLTRRQMFGPVGGRPRTVQHVSLGASRDGTLIATRHTSTSNTSTLEDWIEPALNQTRMLYACPNVQTQYDVVRINVGSPTFQRAPGESTGTFALESAMDELAYALEMDPIELRLKNYAERDPESGKPWSSKSLRECYRVAADAFGWSKRNPVPRSMRDGRWLVGYGMATATYPARRQQAASTARLLPDGRVWVRAGTQEIGCGTYTAMSQIAADALGIPVDRVRFELGDTTMPENPASTGSVTAASTGSSVHDTAMALRQKIEQLAPGGLASNSVAEIIAKNGGQPVEVTLTSRPGQEQQQYSMHSFGGVFTEVRVDPDLGLIRVPRIVTAHGVGRILNEKTASSQIRGGVIWGIGMALLEETHIDPHTGRYLNADLAEYQVPVNADVGTIDVHFVDENDPHVSTVGAKGAGEIGITGVAASIANAVYHATGRRVRELPIRLDKLVMSA
ncbi:MAG TPA: xanthine dehydrogenase family protein molybdopterin-binding subunit [Gemmatimonadaceae bacterium]|nr:xanthine dehydrogenase family protein molybdopterin-binding subunit [Gemmatimonadaceae bacterium]